MKGVTSEVIAKVINLSERAVQQRAKRESWLWVPERVRGGVQRLYPVTALPPEVREKVIEHLSGLDLTPSAANANTSGAPAVEIAGSVAHLTPSPVSVDLPSSSGLRDWQRQRQDARAAILLHLESLAQIVGTERAVRAVVEAAEDATLPPSVQQLVPIANARSGGPGKRALCRRTLLYWRANAAKGTHALAPKAAPVRGMPVWARDFLRLYRRPGKPSVAQVVEQLQRELGPAAPSYQQAIRFRDKLTPVTRERGRRGPQALKALKAFKRRSTDGLAPLDVIQMDGHTLDADAQHPESGRPFRPEVTTAIDWATHRAVGWSVAMKESTWSVMDAIRCVVERCGVPAVLYTDNGSGYVNAIATADVTGYLARLGITHSTSLPNSSQSRGLIEKAQADIWVRGARLLPSYVGMDMDREAAKAIAKRRDGELAAEGRSRYLPTWPEFIAWAEAQVQQYNARPHRSLPKITDPETGKRRHQTPDEAWAQHVAGGWEPIHVGESDLLDLFRPYEVRTTSRGEVSLWGSRYFHPALVDHHGDKVLVGYDIHDPGRVWVRDETQRLIAVAGLNANATPAFPKSVVERARDQRLKGQLQRLENRAHEKIAQHGGYRIEADAPRSEPTQIEMEQLEAEMSAPPATPRLETAKDRFFRAKAILASGPMASPEDAAWAAVYATSPEFQTSQRFVEDFGEDALDSLN